MKDIYPLTITKDRYGGAYSHGNYLAFNLQPYDVPLGLFSDDITAATFWQLEKYLTIKIGKGDTIEEAIQDLEKKLEVEDK